MLHQVDHNQHDIFLPHSSHSKDIYPLAKDPQKQDPSENSGKDTGILVCLLLTETSG